MQFLGEKVWTYLLKWFWYKINNLFSETCPSGNLIRTLTAIGSEASGSSGISLASSIFCCWINATLAMMNWSIFCEELLYITCQVLLFWPSPPPGVSFPLQRLPLVSSCPPRQSSALSPGLFSVSPGTPAPAHFWSPCPNSSHLFPPCKFKKEIRHTWWMQYFSSVKKNLPGSNNECLIICHSLSQPC